MLGKRCFAVNNEKFTAPYVPGSTSLVRVLLRLTKFLVRLISIGEGSLCLLNLTSSMSGLSYSLILLILSLYRRLRFIDATLT